MADQRIQIGDINYYTKLSVATDSPVNTPPVLLIHALMANHHMWDSTVIALNKAGYNTLQVDNIGHNETTAPTNFKSSMETPIYHFDDMAKHLKDLVSAVTGQQKVEAVIGCSMGGVLALRYGLLFPKTITNGIICCDAPGATSLEAAKPLWSQRIEQFERDQKEGTETLFHATAERWLPGDDEESKQARAKALDIVRTCTLNGYKICADGIRSYDYHSQLANLRIRTMVLAGRDDSAIGPPSVTEGIAAAIPGCKLVWMEKTGHLPALHRPEAFEKIVVDWLKQRSDTNSDSAI